MKSLVVFFGNPVILDNIKKVLCYLLVNINIPEFGKCYIAIEDNCSVDIMSSQYERYRGLEGYKGDITYFFWKYEDSKWYSNCMIPLPSVKQFLGYDKINYTRTNIEFNKTVKKDILDNILHKYYFKEINFISNRRPNLVMSFSVKLDKSTWLFEGKALINLWRNSIEILISPEEGNSINYELSVEITNLIQDLYINSPYYYINYFPNVLKDD